MKPGLICAFVIAAVAAMNGVAQPLPQAAPESVGLSSERLETLAEAIESEIDVGRMPGAVIAIARRGKLAYYEAFGYLDPEAGVPMPRDAIFSIASMTKPIFGVAAMMLYERGDLLLNEPLTSYLPELGQQRVAVDGDSSRTVPAIREPTIRDLMRHTSGHPGRAAAAVAVRRLYDEAIYSNNGGLSPHLTGAEYIEALAALPLSYQPGTTWDYSIGFDLLGIAIERVTGQRAYDFLRTGLFGPLGMQDTYFTLPQAKVKRQAKPLPTDPLTGTAQTVRDQTVVRMIDCGSGCLASTAADYLAFAQMLLNRGSLNGTRILGPKTVEYMTSDHAATGVDLSNLHEFAVEHMDGYGFGLSVAVRRSTGGGGAVGSPGEYHWSGAQGTAFWVDPEEELVIVYMAQTPGPLRRYYRQLIPALVYQAIAD